MDINEILNKPFQIAGFTSDIDTVYKFEKSGSEPEKFVVTHKRFLDSDYSFIASIRFFNNQYCRAFNYILGQKVLFKFKVSDIIFLEEVKP